MKKIIMISIFSMFTLALFASGNREGEERHFGNVLREHNVQPFSSGDSLDIDLRTGGDLQIIGTDAKEMTIDIVRTGDAVEEADLTITPQNGGIRITSRFKSRHGGRGGIDLTIHMPHEAELKVKSVGGDIHIEGIFGDFKGETMGGDILLTSLSGEINMETMGGDIEVSDSTLNGRVRTMGGDINVIRHQGNLDAKTMGGEVKFVDSVLNDSPASGMDSSKEEPVVINSMGGDIRIDRAPKGVNAETMGGDIIVDSAREYVIVQTMGGDISLQDIDGYIEAETMGGDIKAVMSGDPGEGKRDVQMNSMGGSLELKVPEGLGMTVDITLELSRRSLRTYQIISDFDLEIIEREATALEKRNGIVKVIKATGVIGDGRNKIILSTTGGNITLE